MELMWRVISWVREGENKEKGSSIKKYKLVGME